MSIVVFWGIVSSELKKFLKMLVKYELTASGWLATVQGEGVETSSKQPNQQVWTIEIKNETRDWKFDFSDVISKYSHDLKEKRNLIYIFEIIENLIIPPSQFNCPPQTSTYTYAHTRTHTHTHTTHRQHNGCAK